MKNEFEALIKAAKDFKEYQSIGNRAKLNCAIEDAEKVVKNCSIPAVVERSKQCCSPTDGFYLGTTCPHCKKPFRKDIK